MAKRYTFRFETLLRLRQQREDEEKRVVASRLREIHRLEQHQQSLLGRIEQQTDLTRSLLTCEEVEVEKLKMGRHWMVHLRRGVLEAEAELTKHKAMLAHERANLMAVARNRKILSRLKERRRDRYDAEQNRLEQLEQDEMNTLRFARLAIAKGGD